ncbi:hypothetical protein CIB48_g11728 [Xylaria polymorpha]|nr:hypothetical protein CIB48_g11728 [Xylaria polymorpha]
MPAKPPTTDEGKELGYSRHHGVNWSEYILYRPIYPESFFRRIYDYHAQKPGISWSTAHDVGAGPGIVSSTLANRFDRVVVSDPNDGYIEVSRQLLVEKSGFSESKFVFLLEGAEKSSVETATVDLIAACECMQWTNTVDAVDEFARQLKPGGTLAMTFYTRPLILDNERPPAHWEAVKRVYINCSQGIKSFKISDKLWEDSVGINEERIWINGDPDWSDKQAVDWLRGYFGTWLPRPPESEVRHLWDELERIVNDAKIRLETPAVMVFATRRA